MFKKQFYISIFLVLVAGPVFAFEFKGFSDVIYTQSGSAPKDCKINPDQGGCEFENGAFGLGALDFYVAQNISDRINVLSEFVIETPGAATVVDLERLEVGYSFSDLLNVRVGRFHNLLGYWNLNFHHGAHLQTSITRPEFLNFEDDGGIIPTHMVGAWLKGRVKTNPLNIEYGLMTGNGISLVDKEILLNVANDNNKEKDVSFNLKLIPTVREELSLNIFGHRENDLEYDSATILAKKGELEANILGFDIAYNTEKTEIIAEYYTFSNKDKVADQKFSSSAYYIHAGYKIGDLVNPYVRYENTTLNVDDPYFTVLGVGSNQRIIYGLKKELGMMSAVKLEGREIKPKVGNSYQEYAMQWSFGF